LRGSWMTYFSLRRHCCMCAPNNTAFQSWPTATSHTSPHSRDPVAIGSSCNDGRWSFYPYWTRPSATNRTSPTTIRSVASTAIVRQSGSERHPSPCAVWRFTGEQTWGDLAPTEWEYRPRSKLA